MQQMEVLTKKLSGWTLMSLAGEVDMFAASCLKESLDLVTSAEGSDNLVVDLRRVGFMDAVALSLLVRALKRTISKQSAMSLVVGEGQVKKLLDVSGLQAIFGVFESIPSAIASGTQAA